MGQIVSIKEHKKKKKRALNHKMFRIVAFCLFFALIGFGLSQSPIFNVKHINVSGNENIDSELILELSGIKEGQHIYSFRTGRAETMISTNPWVDSVEVSRSFPNSVNIKITERKAVAAVAAGDGVVIIDSEGYVLTKQMLFDGLGYMLIIGADDLRISEKSNEANRDKPDSDNASDDGAKDEKPEEDIGDISENEADTEDFSATTNEQDNASEDLRGDAGNILSEEDYSDVTEKDDVDAEYADEKAYDSILKYDEIICGKKLESEKLQAGLDIAMGMSEDDLSVVTQINVLDIQNVILDTVYGIKIYFGDSEDLEKKFEVTNSILQEENEKGHVTKIKYIDVSVPSRPALKYNN